MGRSMAETLFVALSTVWLMGFAYLQAGCARLEADFDPNGALGALMGTGWLRGSTQDSRRARKFTLWWAGLGLMVLVLATHAARTFMA